MHQLVNKDFDLFFLLHLFLFYFREEHS